MPDGSAPEPLEPVAIPPHDMQAEAAVLSTLFLAPDATVELEPEHFYSEANAWIMRAIRATPSPVDIVTVTHWLRNAGRLAQVGGQPYLFQVLHATPAVGNVSAHAAVVRELWRRRVLIQAFQRCVTELYAGELGAGDAWKRMKECCDA